MGEKAFLNFREESRNRNWGTNKDLDREGTNLSMEQLTCGCMLRIADSLEEIRPVLTNLAGNTGAIRLSTEMDHERERRQRREITRLKKQIKKLRTENEELKSNLPS